MISLLITLSMLEFRHESPGYTPSEFDNLQTCVLMSTDLDHKGCTLGGNYYGTDDKKYFVWDEYCIYTGENKVSIYERKYVITDLEKCEYKRYGDGYLFGLTKTTDEN